MTFEQAMIKAGWLPKYNLLGEIVAWQFTNNGYERPADKARKYWDTYKITPVPF